MQDHLQKQLQHSQQNQQALEHSCLSQFSQQFTDNIQKNGVVLLDGLDEVASGFKRDTLLTAIRQFIADENTSKHVHVILTSRPTAYNDHLSIFRQLDIEPMQGEEVEGFVRHWYRQIASQKNTPADDTQLQNRASSLLEEINRRPSLGIMTETPLLLTLLLTLELANYQLPRSRADLYDRAVRLLLQRWHRNLLAEQTSLTEQEQIALTALAETGVSSENLRKALSKLALASYKNAENKQHQEQTQSDDIIFSTELVLGHLSKAYQGSIDLDAVSYFLQYRSNILVAAPQDDDLLSFVHKSFHEFLAAEAFEDKPNSVSALHTLLNHPQQRIWWREVLLFWMNKKGIGELADFISQPVLTPLNQIATTDLENHAGIIQLCTQAAIEATLQQQVLQDDDNRDLCQLFQALQQKLLALMTAPQLEISVRAECGRLLGRLADDRPGVGIVRKAQLQTLLMKTGQYRHPIPDIVWEKIPAGRFQMGSTQDDTEAYDFEKPAHSVSVNAFCISRYPVTNAQYQCFIEAGGYQNQAYWKSKSALSWLRGEQAEMSLLEDLSDEQKKTYKPWLLDDQQRKLPRFWQQQRWNNPNHPVVGICWHEALAYCKWLSECLQKQALAEQNQLDQEIRLPNEAEWEYAARGVQGLSYAWGDDPDPLQGNYDKTGLERTSSVGLFSSGSAFDQQAQLHDMTGNVWEWTQSRWGKSPTKTAFDYQRWGKFSEDQNDADAVEWRIIRGGSWDDDLRYVRCAVRNGIHPYNRSNDVGFRVVYSLAADS